MPKEPGKAFANLFPASDTSGQMQSPTKSDSTPEAPPIGSKRGMITEPNFDRKPRPIAELAGRADFPECALGEFVDIGGYTGVVVGIVHNSIKVRSPEGPTQSFNFHRLRTLYSPVEHPEPVPSSRSVEQPKPPSKSSPAEPPATVPAPRRDLVTEPDFTAPVKPITEFAGRLDFPKCAFGQHVDVVGFKGVVVEVVKLSLKVKSVEGVTRSYNAVLLQKLYGNR